MPPIPPTIKLENVTVGYLTETVIRNLSLQVEKGELLGVFGPNGSGKTTLLCAVNGLAVQRGGTVFVNGKKLNLLTGINLRKIIGFVPQHFEIDPRLPVSAREVVLMGRYARMGMLRFAGKKEQDVLDELTELFAIEKILGKPFGQLSGGEKKRVLIARALAKEPDILLLDEIFAWLDRKMEEKLIEIIRKIHEKMQLTTMIVSHDLKVIASVCTRVVWMEKGKIAFEGDTEEFLGRVKT